MLCPSEKMLGFCRSVAPNILMKIGNDKLATNKIIYSHILYILCFANVIWFFFLIFHQKMQKRKSFGNNRPCDICLILFHLFRCLISIFVIVHEYPRGLKMTIVEGKWIKIVIPEDKSIIGGSIRKDTDIVKHFYHHGYKFKSHDEIMHIIPICASSCGHKLRSMSKMFMNFHFSASQARHHHFYVQERINGLSISMSILSDKKKMHINFRRKKNM